MNTKLVAACSAGPLLVFGASMLFAPQWTIDAAGAGFNAAGSFAGLPWQVWMVVQFIIGVGLAVSPFGKLQLGGQASPDRSFGAWIALLLCTLLAGGGVFWSAAEPLYHFQTLPPVFDDVVAKTAAAVGPALAQCHLHWGTLAWCSVALLGAIVLMVGEELHGLPLRPRSLIWPLLGGEPPQWLGVIIDAISIIAVVAGTVGPIGFLALQLSSAGDQLFGIPDGAASQLGVLVALVVVFTLSAISGIDRGIALLSRLNVTLALILGVGLLVFGVPAFVGSSFVDSMVLYLANSAELALGRENTGWLGFWTVFYWGWFLGYAPIMSAFVARVSRGRTVRELTLAVAVLAPLLTHIWFSVLGGTGLGLELETPGVITKVLAEQGMASTLIAIVGALPGAPFWIGLTLLLVFCFLATTADSMAYAVSVVVTGEATPPIAMRLGWAVGMGALTALLLVAGDGSINALQQFIVITAVPVTFILLPTAVTAPMALKALNEKASTKTQS